MQTAALQTRPRYNAQLSTEPSQLNHEVKPLVRWLDLCPNKPFFNPPAWLMYGKNPTPDEIKIYLAEKEVFAQKLKNYQEFNINNFVNETFIPGATYSYPRHQSMSKSEKFAEGVHRDDNPGMNMKFVIHPKSKISKAYDIGMRDLGANEAIYPAETPFKILDRKLEEAHDSVGNPFYRRVVEMQEI